MNNGVVERRKMSNKLFLILVGVFVLIVLLFGVDKCGQSKKVLRLEGANQELESNLKVQRKVSMDTIKKKDNIIAQQDEQILELLNPISESREESETLGVEIEVVEEAYDETAPESEQIVNLKAQVKLWKHRFTLFQEIIDNLGIPIEYLDENGEKQIGYPIGTVTFKLDVKYKSEVVISNKWKGMYEGELELNENLIEQVKFLKRQMGRIKFGSGIKTTMVMVAIIYIVIRMVL